MKVYINDTEIEIFSGATVLNVLRAYYARKDETLPAVLPRVTDKYGNQVASDGELSEGNKLYIKEIKKRTKMKTTPPKLLTQIVLLMLILGLFTGCGSKRKAAASLPVSDKKVEILAVNDIHAALDNFPRFAFMVDSLRAIYPNLLLISGGDNQTGNPINDMFPKKGMPVIELMNAVKFDLSAVGNHEFDSKIDGFSEITHVATFDYLCANAIPPQGSEFRINPYKIVKMPNGAKIAFVGLLHINNTGIPDSHPDNLKGFVFKDPFQVARQYLYLKDSCDLLVYINHMGFDNDVKLVDQLPAGAIDLIIGGHSHTKVDKDFIQNGIMITQAERKLAYASLIQLTIKPDGKVDRSVKLLTVGKKGNERSDVRAMVDKFNDNPVLREKIAEAQDDFTTYEQIGYLMADAMRENAKTEIALVNPGGVRIDHLPKGSVSPLNVYSMDPFGNEIVIFRLTGAEIRAMLMSAFKLDDYLPIYPSGMKSRYTLSADRNVKDVQLFLPDNTPLDMTKTYTVAVNSYMASVYKYEHQDPGTGLFIAAAESMIGYLRDLKNIPSYRNEKRVEIE